MSATGEVIGYAIRSPSAHVSPAAFHGATNTAGTAAALRHARARSQLEILVSPVTGASCRVIDVSGHSTMSQGVAGLVAGYFRVLTSRTGGPRMSHSSHRGAIYGAPTA